MTDRYVRKTGVDTNNGLTPATAYLTVAKLLTVMVAGDVGHLGAGSYRETVTLASNGAAVGGAITGVSAAAPAVITTTSAHGLAVGQYVNVNGVVGATEVNGPHKVTAVTATTYTIDNADVPSAYVSGGTTVQLCALIGDVDGSVTGDLGPVILTAYTTNDTTAPAASHAVEANGHAGWLFQNLHLYGGNSYGSCVDARTSGGSHDLSFLDCLFQSGVLGQQDMIGTLTTYGTVYAWYFDRCIWVSQSLTNICLFLQLARGAAGDFDYQIYVRNSRFWLGAQSWGVQVGSTGAGANFGGGVRVVNCSFFSGQNMVNCSDASLSTTVPAVTITGCLGWGQQTCLTATTSGQIAEDHCVLAGNTARTNVTAGTGSQSGLTYAVLAEFGQAAFQGRLPRHFLEPAASSPLLGFGNASIYTPKVDATGRPRPAGGGSNSAAVGALERHDTFTQDSSGPDSGTYLADLVCPGDRDRPLNVTSGSRTYTVKYKSDSGVVPTITVKANPAIGVNSDVVATGTAAQGTWTTLTLNFSPTSTGTVIVRFGCTGTANSRAYFDTESLS